MKALFDKYYKQRKKHVIVFAITYALSVFVYSLLMTARLVNTYDGLWNGSFFAAGEWEVSCGRFVWPILNIARAWLCQDPYMTLISLAVICLALVALDSILGIDRILESVLINSMFIANVVVCAFLSFRFMSTTFAFSFLFSVLVVEAIVSIKRRLNVIIAALCIILSMGLYQANIGCTCVILIAYTIISILNRKEFKCVIRTLIDAFLSAILGGAGYIALSKLFLMIYHTEMSSYHGGSSYSVKGMLLNMPQSLVRVYQQFISYFFRNQYFVTIYSRFHSLQIITAVVLLLILICLVIWIAKYKWEGVCAGLMVCLMPVASSVILLVVTEGGNSIQMTAPQALVIPSLITLIIATSRITDGRVLKISTLLSAYIIGIVFLHTEALQVYLDQSEMLESTRATTWMYNSVIDDIKDADLLDPDYEYLFYGKPSANSLYLKPAIYQYSNAYARVGDYMSGNICYFLSWNGVKNNLGGVQINISNEAAYDHVCEDEAIMSQINQMKVFPEDGYIKRIGKTVIIKISESEE